MSVRNFFSAAFAAVAFSAIPHIASAANFPATGAGGAYAAFLKTQVAGVNVDLGAVAPVGVCAVGGNGSQQNYVATLTPNPIVGGISALDTINTYRTSTNAAVVSTSTLQNVTLLNGLITVGAVNAVANSFGSASGASSSATGSSLANLVINGKAYSASIPPNTKVTLPGLGYVILNQQLFSKPGTPFTELNVNMISIHVTTPNSLGIPTGAIVIVGHATSQITMALQPFNVSAGAYGAAAHADIAGTQAKAGPIAAVGLCQPGTGSAYLASANTPLGTIGATQDTAAGINSASLMSGTATSQVASVNLLGGLISGGALSSNAATTYNGIFASSGSATFSNLTIAGIPIMATPPANTKITIPGFGYVILNEQSHELTKTAAGDTVTAMHVFITTQNLLGIGVGAEALIGATHTGISGY